MEEIFKPADEVRAENRGEVWDAATETPEVIPEVLTEAKVENTDSTITE